jgi:hypothetical protein
MPGAVPSTLAGLWPRPAARRMKRAMATPEFSDTTTVGVRVGATGYYLPEESDAESR